MTYASSIAGNGRPVAVMLYLAGCSTVLCTGGLQTQEISADVSIQTVRAVDAGLRRLADPSADPRKVLERVVEALPSADTSIRSEVRSFVARIPQPGPEFECSEEFIRLRARQGLRRIRDALLGARPDPSGPAVCYALPFALDMGRANPNGRLDIFGYDFDTVPVQLIVVTPDGYRDVTSRLAVKSHYHLVLNLTDGSLPSNAQSIGVVWGHLIRFSVPVISPTTPFCASRIETIPARIASNVPQLIRVTGTGARLQTSTWAEASLDYSNNQVEATVCLSADHASDGRLASGCTVEFLYTTDPDSVIEGIFGSLHSSVDAGESATASTSGQRINVAMPGARGSLVRRWSFSGPPPLMLDTVDVELNPIRLVSTRDEACVSPLAYSEARRTWPVSATTRHRLDPQLRRIDRSIVTLRPRFAPPARMRRESK